MMPIDFDCFFINRRRMNYLFLRIQINGHNMLKKNVVKRMSCVLLIGRLIFILAQFTISMQVLTEIRAILLKTRSQQKILSTSVLAKVCAES